MLKALVKKEFQQLGFSLTRGNRNRKGVGAGMKILLAVCFLYLGGFFIFLFLQASSTLAPLLVPIGMNDLYFAIMGLMATAIGIVGSVFSTYATLYQGKDNEQLLAMPIPPYLIVIARMITCYITTAVFEMLVFLPTYYSYFKVADATVSVIIIGIINLLIHPLLALSLACVLSFLIALVIGRLPSNMKTGVTVIMTLAFIGLYMFVYTKAMDVITSLDLYVDSLTDFVSTYLALLLYQGAGCAGRTGSYLIFAAVCVALFGVIFFIISKSFIRFTTVKKSGKKKAFKKVALRSGSIRTALLRKEFGRLKSSSAYLLNGAIGALFMPIVIVLLIIFHGSIEGFVSSMFESGMPKEMFVALLPTIASFFITMNQLTTASVSMEGRTLWLSRSLPVSEHDILAAKLMLHNLLTLPFAVCLVIVGGIVFKLEAVDILLISLLTAAVAFLFSIIGLCVNLRHPNLDWTNEMAAVKNNIGMAITMFGEWLLIVGLAVPCFAADKLMFIRICLLAEALVCAAISAVLYRLLMTKGTKALQAL